MKFYKPLFSSIVIVIQLILSIISYYGYVAWGEANPEMNRLISRLFHGDSLFLFVLIIGFYEMQTKPSWFKTAIRIFLVCIVLGAQFSELIPIDQFYFGVYNTAWFAAIVTILLILIRIGNYSIRKIHK
ncbi:hypothetical protein [uncultured Dokdonia sp.]|uniref:hypothetical protein n=1 Tax=uncultured Dokdonia sp. TaxID=575653 RepID=UPI00260E0AF6|nr:hypothetical protein [uncultured Dokdonia sp.]